MHSYFSVLSFACKKTKTQLYEPDTRYDPRTRLIRSAKHEHLNFASLSFWFRPSSDLYSKNPFHWYLDLINDSFVERGVSTVGFSQPFCKDIPASHIEFAILFPRARRSLLSPSLRSSSLAERTCKFLARRMKQGGHNTSTGTKI